MRKLSKFDEMKFRLMMKFGKFSRKEAIQALKREWAEPDVGAELDKGLVSIEELFRD